MNKNKEEICGHIERADAHVTKLCELLDDYGETTGKDTELEGALTGWKTRLMKRLATLKTKKAELWPE